MQIRRIKEGEFPGDPIVRTIGFSLLSPWVQSFPFWETKTRGEKDG